MENNTNSSYDSSAPRDPQTNHNNGGFNDNMDAKLPADPTSMTLAIIATCTMVICCCFGGSYITMVLSVVGLILATKSMKTYDADPHNYSAESYRKVANAKTFNLVLVVISGIFIVLGILSTILQFTFLDQEFFENILEGQGFHIDEDYGGEEFNTDDTIYETTEDDWKYEEEPVETSTDSLSQDIDPENGIIEDEK